MLEAKLENCLLLQVHVWYMYSCLNIVGTVQNIYEIYKHIEFRFTQLKEQIDIKTKNQI